MAKLQATEVEKTVVVKENGATLTIDKDEALLLHALLGKTHFDTLREFGLSGIYKELETLFGISFGDTSINVYESIRVHRR